jgi:hypothetical protein
MEGWFVERFVRAPVLVVSAETLVVLQLNNVLVML